MKDILKITLINKNKNRIEYDYQLNGLWKELLKEDNKMWIEYNENIESVPDSICVVPFLCNVLPICWIYDLEIEVDILDDSFAKCIDNVKKGYQKMHPTIPMLGKVTIKKKEKNKYPKEKSITLFSGGVDAFQTLFQHMDESPMLFTLWGADVKLTDEKGWNTVSNHHTTTAKELGLEYTFAKTNFRETIQYNVLTKYVSKLFNTEWWHDFQHGIAILSHTAPIAYLHHVKNVYIASSFTKEYWGIYKCASDPVIDNELKFGTTEVIHDGYEFNRQEKVHNICEYVETNKLKHVPLRVCWISTGGENCCECEKCTRTLLAILAEKKDPKKYGFDITEQKWNKIIKKLPSYSKYYSSRYQCVQDKFKENYSEGEMPKGLEWFRNFKIYKEKPKFILIRDKVIYKIKRFIIKIIRKEA